MFEEKCPVTGNVKSDISVTILVTVHWTMSELLIKVMHIYEPKKGYLNGFVIVTTGERPLSCMGHFGKLIHQTKPQT